MRVAISGLFWSQESTGSGQYTRLLTEALLGLGGEEYILFLAEGMRCDLPLEARSISTPFSPSSNLSKLWFEQVAFPRSTRGIDLAHVPYFAPPLFPSTATVATIHDLIPLILPLYRGSLMVRLYTQLVSSGAKRASAIITDSSSSRRDIMRLLSIREERIHVIPLAAHPTFGPVRDEAELERIRQNYGLPGAFLLYLGGFDQRKNLRTLFAALKMADVSCPLVIPGNAPACDTPFFPNPRRMAEESEIKDRVLYIGRVPEEDKPALYGLATAFLYPSLYEGFGLPPLEAMACGTPVIASNSSSLPEVVGEAGILLDPRDGEAWAQAISRVLGDPSLREAMRAKGLKRAQGFSWRRTAERTLGVYRRVLEQ